MKINLVPTNDTRFSPEFLEVRKAVSKIEALENDPTHTQLDARLALDEFCAAWTTYRTTVF